jgi:hypothetical protein
MMALAETLPAHLDVSRYSASDDELEENQCAGTIQENVEPCADQ